MSRFTLVDGAPTRSPGVDYLTGTTVGPFIDTGKDVQLPDGRKLGRIYLAKSTVEELAREFGITNNDKVRIDALVNEAYNRGKLDGLKEEIGGDLNDVVNVLRRWLTYVDPASSASK